MLYEAGVTEPIDRDLDDLPPEARWRAWMSRAEAVIFASPRPVDRKTLAAVVGDACNLDRLMDAIAADLAGRPFEIVAVAGGWQYRTRPDLAPVLRAAGIAGPPQPDLSQNDLTVLMAVAYFQPVTRAEVSSLLGRPVSRDTLAALARKGFIAAGPRSPRPGAPKTHVTTRHFLTAFSLGGLMDLPDMDDLAESGLLDRRRLDAADPQELQDLFFRPRDTG